MPAATDWKPTNAAIWKERAHGTNRVITLRHPVYPFEADWTTEDSEDLKKIAGEYLSLVKGEFELPADLLVPGDWTFADRASGFQMAWLPLGPVVHDPNVHADPRMSFWIRRYRNPSTHSDPIDQTAVLLVVQSVTANDPRTAIGSRLGIRIIAHVSAREAGTRKVRITGASCSVDLADAISSTDPGVTVFLQNFGHFSVGAFKTKVGGAGLLAVAGLSGNVFWIDGLRVLGVSGNRALLEVYANVPSPDPEIDRYGAAYALTAKVSFGANFSAMAIESVEKSPLAAHVTQTNLFPQDPPSLMGPDHVVRGRPNRSPDRLEPYRRRVNLQGITPVAGNVDLIEDLACFRVTTSNLVNPNANQVTPETVVRPDRVPSARTNPFAALSAYQHARELFDRMRGYGISPALYFKFALPQLLVRYRATMIKGPGKDGKTVNAEVDYDPPGYEAGTVWNPNANPLKPLQVRFALADLKRSASRREPLGLAADPRWAWHEFGHVLLAAATGELEFRFAHSAGDALAAIVNDPLSALAPHPRLRWATFPWVYLNRRHDRSVWHGWSWSGTYHRPVDFPSSAFRRKGYHSEQILATSLFRLYRSLGGDTVLANGNPDPASRQAAADYAVYLIMRAIEWLGPVSGVPAETPDQFVSALVDADIGTGPSGAGPLAGRVGGCAYKVARWAFEAQGLDANRNPSDIVNAPGSPPNVDIFIDNRRPDSEGTHPRGGYMPVSLDWHAWPNASSWHATGAAISVAAGGRVTAEVCNRGRLAANGVVVRVWWARRVGGGPIPKWPDPAWTLLGSDGPKNVPAWPASAPQPVGTPTRFTVNGFPAAAGRYLILAEATCPDDRANTDAATGLPCATSPTSIVDLVAGDNNLALLVHP